MGKRNRKREPPLQSKMSTEIEKRKSLPPLLLTIHYTEHGNHTIYRPLNGETQNLRIPILVHKYIMASTHGWLVLVDQIFGDCLLWNASSQDMIKLPRLQSFDSYGKCVLSKPPNEPDCHILFSSADLFQQAFCRIGDVEFVYQSHPDDELLAIASFQEKIYGVMSNDFNDFEFVTIEFVGRTIEFRPILINDEQPLKAPVIKKNWVPWNEFALIDSHTGELLFVMKDLTLNSIMDGSEFRVFRIDINRMECTEIDDIGDQVILTGQYGTGFCCPSSGTTFKPNSIYYVLEFHKCVYVYDLDDKSTSSWLPPHDVVGLHNLIHFWVTSPPRISR